MRLSRELYKELQKIIKQEEKWLNEKEKTSVIKEKIYDKVPEGLSHTLELAFEKAFALVFLKGTKILEKTFDKEMMQMEYAAGNELVEQMQNQKSIKLLERQQKKGNIKNHTSTTAAGFGLGLLGMGLPDIPLLVCTILKGIYEVALSYGYSYEEEKDQIYILRLIRTALSMGKTRQKNFSLLAAPIEDGILMSEEVTVTAKALSDALLVEKFVQGIPVVGMVGGFVNHAVYKKIIWLAKMEYKKKYILSKGKD